ncbi:extensin-like [Solanum verrucosum]|uniref:extensin-like n=1 Tax=Solanum verrucosum TaxID=315347 RepID=UPI0020D15534|nr:extensin-like [Solanum verrucosum]
MAENWKKTGSVMMTQGTRTPYKYRATTPPPSPYPQTPYPSAPPPISPHPMPVYYQNAPLQYQQASYPVYNAQPTYFQTPPPTQTPNYRNRSPYERKPTKNYTPLAKSIAQLYERLKEAG